MVIRQFFQKKITPRPAPPNLSSTSTRSSMALFLLCRHTAVTLTPPPLRPASRQLLSSSASAAAYLLIVIFLSLLSTPLLPLRHQSSVACLQPPLSSKQWLLQLNHCALPLASRHCYPPLPPHTCWLLFFAIVVSAVVAPLPPIVHRFSSAAIVLHLIRRRPPPHPTVVPILPLRVLHISWLLLAVGGGAVVAPPPS